MEKKRLEIGTTLYHFTKDDPPQAAPAEEFLRMGEVIEDLGFDAIWSSDRLLRHTPILDGFMTLSALAARTRRIRLGAMVVVPIRHPVVQAKALAVADYFSGGRIIFSPGIGGDYPHEFVSAGADVSERVPRTVEALEVMRRLWSEDNVQHQGRFYQVQDGFINPKPIQPGGPPFWFMHRAKNEASMRRTARMGQGWVASWASIDRLRRGWDATKRYAEEYGRSIDEITLACVVRVYVHRDRKWAQHHMAETRSRVWGHPYSPAHAEKFGALGRPEDCLELLHQYLAEGVQHLIIDVPGSFEELEEQLYKIKEEIIPHLR